MVNIVSVDFGAVSGWGAVVNGESADFLAVRGRGAVVGGVSAGFVAVVGGVSASFVAVTVMVHGWSVRRFRGCGGVQRWVECPQMSWLRGSVVGVHALPQVL